MVKKQRYAVFYGEFEKEQKKDKKKIGPSGAGIRNLDFQKFSCP
jgi:hypothetical protein